MHIRKASNAAGGALIGQCASKPGSAAETEGLAPFVAREIWRVIAALRQDGVATIIVDRNYGAVPAHTDRCAILVKGQIIADLPSGELRSRPELLHRHLGV